MKNEILTFKEIKKQEDYNNSINSNERYSNNETDVKFAEMIIGTLLNARLTHYFRSEISSLKRYISFLSETTEDPVYIDSEEYKQSSDLSEPLNSILSKVNLLFYVESLSKTNQDKYNYIYAVKLPKYEYFDDVADFTKQLNLIFSIVMSDNKKVKLVGFDKGSEWYQVALDTLADFKVMALFISEVTKWVKIIVEDKLRVNELDMDEDARKMILENMEVNQMLLKDYALKKVLGESGNADDHEEHTKHQMAFERMAELIIKGTKVEVDKQDYSDEPLEEDVTPLELPRIEDIQGLLGIGSDLLIEHNPSSEDE